MFGLGKKRDATAPRTVSPLLQPYDNTPAGEIPKNRFGLPVAPSMHEAAEASTAGANYMEYLAAQGERSKIRSTGLSGSAKVLAVRNTGEWGGMNPILELDLEITPEGGMASSPATLREPIAPLVARGLTPGTVLPCHIDRSDPSRFVIDY